MLLRRTEEPASWRSGTRGALPDDLIDEFVSADWNLAGADAEFNLHPYPARFISALPALALQLLEPRVGVIDPFCGSGTTLEAARAVGVAATGIDLNPVACLLSRVRVSSWTVEDDESAAQHVAGLATAAAPAGAASDLRLERLRASIPRIDHWFEPWAQRLLAGATGYLEELEATDPWRDRIALSISAAVVKLSRQESDTRYAAVDKTRDEREGVALLRTAVERTAGYLRARAHVAPAPSRVFERDARDLSPLADGSHDAAVFSPPYPNAYEYWLYHKYRMYWLQHDPIAVRESEIGARPHYFKAKDPHTEQTFAEQMSAVFSELARVLRRASPLVIVVGDSIIRGRAIDNGELLFDTARDLGFAPRAAVRRTISRQRSSFNSAHGSGRNTEHVLLMESPA